MHISTHLEQTAQTPRHSDIPPLQTYSYTHTRKDTHSTDTNSPKDTYTNPYTHIHTDTHAQTLIGKTTPPQNTQSHGNYTFAQSSHPTEHTTHDTHSYGELDSQRHNKAHNIQTHDPHSPQTPTNSTLGPEANTNFTRCHPHQVGQIPHQPLSGPLPAS